MKEERQIPKFWLETENVDQLVEALALLLLICSGRQYITDH